MNKELQNMRDELIAMAEAEATKLYRLARNLQKRNGSAETIRKIREEAGQLHMCAYPERLLAWDAKYKYEFAFRC